MNKHNFNFQFIDDSGRRWDVVMMKGFLYINARPIDRSADSTIYALVQELYKHKNDDGLA